MRNVLFASLRNGELEAENLWLAYNSELGSSTVLPAENEEARLYKLSVETNLYRGNDYKQVVFSSPSIEMGRGKRGVVLALDFSESKTYAAEIIGCACPKWLNRAYLTSIDDAEKYLSSPQVLDDWLKTSTVPLSYKKRDAILALLDQLLYQTDDAPILLYSSKENEMNDFDGWQVLKTALETFPVFLANKISFATQVETAQDFSDLNIAYVKKNVIDANPSWADKYHLLDIEAEHKGQSCLCRYLEKLLQKGITKLADRMNNVESYSQLDEMAEEELLRLEIEAISDYVTTAQLEELKELYDHNRCAEEKRDERKYLYRKLSRARVEQDDGAQGCNALDYWLINIEKLLPSDKEDPYAPSIWKNTIDSLKKLGEPYVVQRLYQKFNDRAFGLIDRNSFETIQSDEDILSFIKESEQEKLIDVGDWLRKKIIKGNNTVSTVRSNIPLAQKLFFLSADSARKAMTSALLQCKKNQNGENALLWWVRTYKVLPAQITEDISAWAQAKKEFGKYIKDDGNLNEFNKLINAKCEGELKQKLNRDKTWLNTLSESDRQLLANDFGFDIETYKRNLQTEIDEKFCANCRNPSIHSPTREQYEKVSDPKRAEGIKSLFNCGNKTATELMMNWEGLTESITSEEQINSWINTFTKLKEWLGEDFHKTKDLREKFLKALKECLDSNKLSSNSKINLNLWCAVMDAMKAVERLVDPDTDTSIGSNLNWHEISEEIRKKFKQRCDAFFKEQGGAITSDTSELYNKLKNDYGYSNETLKGSSVWYSVQNDCETFYAAESRRNNFPPEQFEPSPSTKLRVKRKKIGVITLKIAVALIILALFTAVAGCAYPIIASVMKKEGVILYEHIADLLQTLNNPILLFLAASFSRIPFLEAGYSLTWSLLMALIYLATVLYFLIRFRKKIDSWCVIKKASRNCCLALPFYALWIIALILVGYFM